MNQPTLFDISPTKRLPPRGEAGKWARKEDAKRFKELKSIAYWKSQVEMYQNMVFSMRRQIRELQEKLDRYENQ